MEQLSEADAEVHELKRLLEVMERENAKLREEMRANVEGYQRQMESRDHKSNASEIQQMLKRENEAYKS